MIIVVHYLYQFLADCGLGWHVYEGHCYKYFGSDREKYTWNDAKELCISSRSHLVSIHSEEEHRFIQTIIPTYDSFSQFFPWIGAKYSKNDWEWEDGSEVDYWDESYIPSGSDLTNRCIAINNWAFGLWQDADCDSGHNYVCKRKFPIYLYQI